ncbi:g11925 [Coccomyxa viridis]|uniref:G11925 protein n=1 Tax=Coccomyxa viridis TaxID=1274662 RepID=A0ABP1G930_9CHLO
MQVGSPPNLHQLPEDILRHIASKLSTREWARIAPTCSILQQLQPSAITTTTSSWIMSRGIPGHVSSVLLWTSRHLEAAATLDITMHPAGIGSNKMWKQLCRDVVGTFPTQRLRASLVSDVAGYRRMHAHQRRMLEEQIPSRLGYSPATDLEEFAAWLAGRMPHLQTLSLFVSACPALPALSRLRHIEIQAIDFSDVNDVLQPMTRLQTALLTCMHMEALIPALDLSQLPCLEHLSLQDVYPERLSIPPKCRLDLHGEGQVIQQFVGSGWEQALTQLHTCTCAWTITRKTGLKVSICDGLPKVLLGQASIQNLSLLGRGEIEFRSGSSFGWFDLGSVTNLTTLHIKTDRDRESECSLYATFCEVGKGACIKFLYDPYEEEEVSWGAIKCMVLEGCKFDTGMSAAMDVYNGAVQACSCGICWVCMRAQKID